MNTSDRILASPSMTEGPGPAPEAGGSLSLGQVCLVFVAFLVAGFALHHQGFDSPMIYDSAVFIEGNVQKFASGDPLQVLAIVPERPVFMLTVYFNYLLTGMNPYYFRLTNLVILASAGVILVLLISIILETPPLRMGHTRSERQAVSVYLGLLFVIHPLQTFVVLYVWQREAILACFFYYSTLAVYLSTRSGRWSRETPGYVLTCLLFLLGILTKENLMTLPAVLLLAELTLLRQTLRQASRRAVVIAAITLPPFLAHLLLSLLFYSSQSVNPEGVLTRLYGHYQSAGLSPLEVALTASRVLFSHLLTIVAPFAYSVPFLKAETISRSLWNPPITAAACCGVVALLSASVSLVRKSPQTVFGILFFVATPAPELLLIPFFLFFGYRAILPMAGVLLVIGCGILAVLPQLRTGLSHRSFRLGMCAAAMVPVICLSAVTLSQSMRWNPLAVWKEALDRLPPFSENVEPVPYLQVLLNLGIQMVNGGDNKGAIQVLARAVALSGEPGAKEGDLSRVPQQVRSDRTANSSTASDVIRNHPGIATSLFYLGLAHLKESNYSEGIRFLRMALSRDPANQSVRAALAKALADSSAIEAALEQLRVEALTNPSSVAARINLGLAYKRSGNLPEAIAQFRKAVDAAPRSAEAHLNLAAAWDAYGNLPMALDAYSKAATAMPDRPDIYFQLGNSLLRHGRLDESIESFQKAVKLKPDYAEANANLGTALLSAGRVGEAIVSLRKALEVIQSNAELHNTLGVALAEQGDNAQAIEHLRKALVLQPDHDAARLNIERMTREMTRVPTGGR